MDRNETDNQTLKLRAAQAADSELIWEWVNDPATRAVSFSTEPIPWEHHSRWFSEKLLDPCCLFFIILSPDDSPIGQIRYDTIGKEAVVSVSLAAAERGKGYGRQAIQLASQQVFDMTAVEIIHAYIKPDNLSSIRAFTRAGFLDLGLTEVRGNLAKNYTLQRKTHDGQLSTL